MEDKSQAEHGYECNFVGVAIAGSLGRIQRPIGSAT